MSEEKSKQVTLEEVVDRLNKFCDRVEELDSEVYRMQASLTLMSNSLINTNIALDSLMKLLMSTEPIAEAWKKEK